MFISKIAKTDRLMVLMMGEVDDGVASHKHTDHQNGFSKEEEKKHATRQLNPNKSSKCTLITSSSSTSPYVVINVEY